MSSQLSGKFPPAMLALSDGTFFSGISIGASGQTTGELVFNTSMSGYQEIITDPSYCGQIINFTCPHIGNVGINVDDQESSQITAAGLVMREYSSFPSNWRSEQSLADYLKSQNIIAIAGVDTRAITRHLRTQGAQGAAIVTDCQDSKLAIELARNFKGLEGSNLTSRVTTKDQTGWGTTSLQLNSQQSQRKNTEKKHVIVYDFGVKQQILRLLADRNCRITLVPATTSAAAIIQAKPDGILLSNGPGDPAACTTIIENIQQLLTHKIPLFGICLGAQLLALALNATTFKMKFGHHGANHPVQDLRNKKVCITSQNHGFAIDETNFPEDLEITHRSLFDHTIQGFEHKHQPVLAFQGHPEASPGPKDIEYLFDHFMQLIQQQANTPCQKELT